MILRPPRRPSPEVSLPVIKSDLKAVVFPVFLFFSARPNAWANEMIL